MMEQFNSKTLADQIRMLSDDTVAIATIEGIKSVRIAELLNQPVEGLLYDLNRDNATNYARLEQGDMRAVNDIAMTRILTRILVLNQRLRL